MPRRFTMTDTHVDALGAQQRGRFETEMTVYLTREFPEETNRKGEGWLRDTIDMGIDTAREYGIILERDVTRYLELMLALSPDFDDSAETPWARHILTDESLRADQKLDRIYESIMFDQQSEDGARDSARRVPRPFKEAAVQTADEKYPEQHPEVDRARFTMGPEYDYYREAWMAEYYEALDDLKVPPVTSRPSTEVAAPAVDPSETVSCSNRLTGNLTVELIDADTDEPVVGTIVQVSDPAIAYALTDDWGEARFEEIAIGEYRIYTVDLRHRVALGNVTVKRGQTDVCLACRQVSSPSEKAWQQVP